MTTWTFEPGHSAAEFKAKHMMVTWVRGSFKNVTGTMKGDFSEPKSVEIEAHIPTTELYSGHPMRDSQLKGEGFLDIENYPEMTFKSLSIEKYGENAYRITGDLTIRDVTKEVVLDAEYLGSWETPFWVDGEDKGPKTRIGFSATARINRFDFGVNWQSEMGDNGVVVGEDVYITIDVEALKD